MRHADFDALAARLRARCPGLSPTGLFAIRARDAAQCARVDTEPRGHAPRGMAYWGVGDLSRWASLAEFGLTAAR